MTLRDMIEADATTVFCNADDFAESVVYLPRGGGANRTFDAVVFREQMALVNEDGSQTIAPVFYVHVPNDSTDGIASEELDVGGDKIRFAVRDGLTVSDRSITQLVTIDNGMLVIECR